jgi:TFIIF-interacting CTD phosphatase-like protein
MEPDAVEQRKTISSDNEKLDAPSSSFRIPTSQTGSVRWEDDELVRRFFGRGDMCESFACGTTRSDTKEQEVDILDKIDSWCMVYLTIGHGGTNRNKQ